LEDHQQEKLRQREQRRQERMQRFSMKRTRKLADDPNASDPSSVSNSTFTLSEEDTSWLRAQAEMVIEPYFMSFDNTWNRLQAIGEFIDDTEDYVNITLDSHRNQLIQADLLLTAASFCVALMTLVAGIFGMNIPSGFEDSSFMFAAVTACSVVFSLGLLVAFVLFMRHKQIAFQ
jgi:magnesium transporter